MDTRSRSVITGVRSGFLGMSLALIVMGAGGLHEAHAQAKTRVAVTAFENKVEDGAAGRELEDRRGAQCALYQGVTTTEGDTVGGINQCLRGIKK